MADHPDDPRSARSGPSRGASLPAARDQAAPKQRHGKRKRGAGRQAKPTPVRALGKAGASAPAVEPDLTEAVIEVEGRSWTVRVLGRSGRGGIGGAPPLLLVGFWEQGSVDSGHAREALVVGRTLAELSASRLEGAFARAAPPRARARGSFLPRHRTI